MKILAFDTSTEWLSVAVSGDDAEPLAFREVRVGPGHSGQILPLIQDALNEAQIKLLQLDAIAFGAGPGSFTGVRIACSTAQGLALGAEIPLVAVSSLQVMAYIAAEKYRCAKVLPLLDARMKEVYASAWRLEKNIWKEEAEADVYQPAQWLALWRMRARDENWFGAGNGLEVFPELQKVFASDNFDASIRPTARAIAALGKEAFSRGEILRSKEAQPYYVRQRVALTIQQRNTGEKL